ncbi:MAG: carboxymuconolactone decarboxylase family protein [Parvularculaceae bacterium]
MSQAHKDYRELMAGINGGIKGLRGEIPDTLKGFSALAAAATADGALDKKTKELIALAIGVALRCDGCIGFHAKALVEAGASDAEVAEMLGMTVYLGGGPALMYAADAWTAYTQLKA